MLQLSILGYILVPIFLADRWWLTALYTVRRSGCSSGLAPLPLPVLVLPRAPRSHPPNAHLCRPILLLPPYSSSCWLWPR